MKGRWRVMLLATACLLFSSALSAENCAAPPDPLRVKRSFKLTVLDSTKTPAAGVKVLLGTVDRYSTMHPVSNGVTDEYGVLNFAKLKAGDFTFQFTDHSGDRQRFNVQVTDAGENSVEYTWPSVYWIPLHTASGILRHDSQPMRHYQVTLEGYPDGNEMGTSDTDIEGRFDLPATLPGRYYMGISRADAVTGAPVKLGQIPISVTMNEGDTAPDSIFVDENACGLVYDQFCTMSPAKWNTSCVQMVDGVGVAIPVAHATLTSRQGLTGSTNLNADNAGVVTFPNLAGGDYELQLFAKGYTPIRRLITVAPGTASCSTPAIISMNVFGSGCAPATQGKGN